ncbi:MAG: signal recognition particle protein [Acidiferrobacterales bacterium]
MFENLSQRLQDTLSRLRGTGRLTEESMANALRDVRMVLLEADVALPAVKAFTDRVREQATGQEVLRSLTPGQAVIKIVHDELVALLGITNDRLNLAVRPPALILMAGLQGSGKTTTVAKLARLLHEREKKKVLVTSADVYRPAGIEQLRRLASDAGVAFFSSGPDENPIDIARAGVAHARKLLVDVVIIDSAGRLHVDDVMMAEIKALHAAVNPVETLFVADSTTGQDAVNSAKAFNEVLPLTGVILTKTDGDARGGAALSIRHVTGQPIKFLGIGERSDALEAFHPDRVASRILGMGDILSIVEEAQRTADHEKARTLAKKLTKGKGFDLEDFRDQLLQMENMGGIESLMERLPGIGAVPDAVKQQVSGKQFVRLVAIINSMTSEERRFPAVIRGSRKRRIANGSGTQVQDVNRLLKQFTQMQKMMKRAGKGGMKRVLRNLQGNLPGKLT